jgi:hypothetical protein
LITIEVSESGYGIEADPTNYLGRIVEAQCFKDVRLRRSRWALDRRWKLARLAPPDQTTSRRITRKR